MDLKRPVFPLNFSLTDDDAPQQVECVLAHFFACVQVLLMDIAVESAPDLKQCTQRFELLFGTKTSPADSIVKIVELYFRLQEMRKKETTQDPQGMMDAFPINPEDAALLDAFVQKIRHTDA